MFRYLILLGVDPNKVTKDLKSAIKGYDQGGVLCTLKHFPGLGSATENTDFHTVNTNLDSSGVPASLSKKVITDLLINKLHYNGLNNPDIRKHVLNSYQKIISTKKLLD